MYQHAVLAFLLSLIFNLAACQSSELNTFTPIFEAQGVEPEASTLIIKRVSDNKLWISNPKRADIRYIPASTSKMPHTLIALETGFAEPDTLFEWDGRKRTFQSWNQNQTLTQAYQRSAIWVYQEIARSHGPETMHAWLSEFDYGNEDIGDGDSIDQYWLDGPLKISAHEQITFLTQLAEQTLPLSPETYQKSGMIFENETTKTHTLFAKTGWYYKEDAMDIGWFVGWVETKNPSDIYAFALNMDMPNQGDQQKRKPIVMAALTAIGAWPE